MEDYTYLHKANILIHVILGTVALLLGLFILFTKKGGKQHKKIGKWFLALLTIVILTGLLGVFFFKANLFLLVLTLLSGYTGYSGFRIVKMKTNTLNPLDVIIALVTLSSGIFFLYYIKSIGMIWSPTIIYSTLGFLFFHITYDLFRYLISTEKYGELWLYEHIYKMIAAFTALLAAATGTIFPNHQPYSQFLPSVFGTILAILFIAYFYKKSKQAKKEKRRLL